MHPRTSWVDRASSLLLFSNPKPEFQEMRITQKAIAEELGVSISLVSRVLSGTAAGIGVPEETIHAVQSLAKRLGYVPNRAAQALKGKSSRTVGVVVYDFKDPFFSDFVGHLQERLHSQGYSTILVGFSDRQIDNRDLSPLRQHLLDAVIILGSDRSGDAHRDIRSTPVFRIGHGDPDESCIGYSPDEDQAAEDLGDYLVSKGVREVQLLRYAMWNHEKRASAMRRAFEARSLQVSEHASSVKPYFELGRAYALRSLDENHLPDVLVCTADQIALGALRGLLERGIEVPKRLKVTGFDDIQFARCFFPSLTTFSQPMPNVIDAIIQRMNDQDFRHGSQKFRCPLIVRESC
jgi:LacI family transcriptional regulator